MIPRHIGYARSFLRKSSNAGRFYNKRGTAEQWIKEGKYALKWTRLSCHDFVDNQVRLQLFALAYDIGEETAAARNALFGFMSELYARGFVKTVNDWCRAHNIHLTGHMDQEEVINPVGTCGDLMKCFKYQDVPGVDNVFFYNRGATIYKIVSSSAYNWDKSLVMSETYGAYNPSEEVLYKEAMDQYAKGINFLMPHSAWLNRTTIQPRLDEEHPRYRAILPAYNNYVGRLNMLLQGGRHVADIGVLYPIAGMNSGFAFGRDLEKCQSDGNILRGTDYIELGELLSHDLRRDFTWLHPEVLVGNCSVIGSTLRLNHASNFEHYRVLILPRSSTISWPALQKMKEFYDNGGAVACGHGAESARRLHSGRCAGHHYKYFRDEPIDVGRCGLG